MAELSRLEDDLKIYDPAVEASRLTGANRQYIEERFDYFLDETLNDLRPTYQFDASCQWSVPQSIIAFLESTGYEDAVRGAISLGGDADTMACIAGAIAEAYYGGVPAAIGEAVLARLDDRLRSVVREFREQYGMGLVPPAEPEAAADRPPD